MIIESFKSYSNVKRKKCACPSPLQVSGEFAGLIQDEKLKKAEIKRIRTLASKYNFRKSIEVVVEYDTDISCYSVTASETLVVGFDTICMKHDLPLTCRFEIFKDKYVNTKKNALILFERYKKVLESQNPVPMVNTPPGGSGLIYAGDHVYSKRLQKINDPKFERICNISDRVSLIYEFHDQPPCHNKVYYDLKDLEKEFKKRAIGITQDLIRCKNFKIPIRNILTPKQLHKVIASGGDPLDVIDKDMPTIATIFDIFVEIYKRKIKSIYSIYFIDYMNTRDVILCGQFEEI